MAQWDWKREYKALYNAAAQPAVVEVPPLSYLMVDGQGDPNTSPAYAAAVAALYAVAYGIKFAAKRGALALDYSVLPLEGLWWADTPVRDYAALPPRDTWRWTMLIGQPPAVTPALVDDVLAEVRRKKALPALDRLRFAVYDEGRAAQILHVGPYADEGPTLARLHQFIHDQGYTPRLKHHEIYLADPRRTAPAKLRTILRQPIAPVGAGPESA